MTRAQDEFNARRQRDRERKTARKRKDPIPQAVLDSKILGKPCRVCLLFGIDLYAVEAHHLVPRSRFHGHGRMHRRENLIPVCTRHHQDHHNTARKIPRSVLAADEIAFIRDETSQSWLDRWYPTERTS